MAIKLEGASDGLKEVGGGGSRVGASKQLKFVSLSQTAGMLASMTNSYPHPPNPTPPSPHTRSASFIISSLDSILPRSPVSVSVSVPVPVPVYVSVSISPPPSNISVDTIKRARSERRPGRGGGGISLPVAANGD